MSFLLSPGLSAKTKGLMTQGEVTCFAGSNKGSNSEVQSLSSLPVGFGLLSNGGVVSWDLFPGGLCFQRSQWVEGVMGTALFPDLISWASACFTAFW